MSWETYNKLVISGPSLEAFKKWLANQPVGYATIAPASTALQENTNYPTWLDYQISEKGGEVTIIFMTRRSTPEPGLEILSQMFPDLAFNCSYVWEHEGQAWIVEIRHDIAHSEFVNVKDPRFRAIAETFADDKTGISCNMNLVVSGPKLKDFATWLGDSPLSLAKILPFPDAFGSFSDRRDSLLPDPNVVLREWCIKHWGSPSEIEPLDYLCEYKNNAQELSLFFNTYWRPPIPAIKILSRNFPDMKFVLSYWMYNHAAGVFTFQNGTASGEESDERYSLYHHVMSEGGDWDLQEERVNQEDDLDLSSFSALSAACMRLLSRHEGHLDLFSLHALSDEGAAVLSEHEGSLSFESLIYLTDTAAEGLAKHKGDIILGGITELSDKAAESLSRHTSSLWLNDLETLSDAVALSLAKHQGQLALFGLKKLSGEAAAILAAQKVLRSPAEVTNLTTYQAESLLCWPAEALCLDGLGALSEEVARVLPKDACRLSLNGISDLSDAAAEALAKHEGELSLNGLKTLSDVAAESLARHKGTISLNGLSMLSAKASRALIGHGAVKTNLDLEKLCQGQWSHGNGGGK